MFRFCSLRFKIAAFGSGCELVMYSILLAIALRYRTFDGLTSITHFLMCSSSFSSL